MSENILYKAIKQTISFSIPLIGFRVVSSINSVIAMLFIAMLGQRELAAGALITPIQTTLYVSGWSIIFAVSVIAGRAFGQRKYADLGKIFRLGWLVGIFLSIPMTLLFWYVGPILRLFGQDESLVVMIQPYFHILALSVLPSILYVSFAQFVSGVGKPRIVFYFSVLNIVFMLIPGYLLLFGKFGLPKLGILGMAYANAFIFFTSFIMCVIYLLIDPYFKQFQLFKFNWDGGWFYFKKILQIGFPMSVQFLCELTAFSFATIMVGWIDQQSLAASQMVTQINMLIIAVPYAISQGSSVLISQAIGRNDKHLTRALGNAGLVVGFIFSLIVIFIYCVFPRSLVHLYSVNLNDPANASLIHLAVILFAINAISLMFDSLRNIATGVLRGFHDTAMPMWFGVIASWGIAIPFGYVLGIRLNWGALGIGMAFLVAWLVGSVLLVRRMWKACI